MQTNSPTSVGLRRPAIRCVATLAVCWFVLTGGDPESFLIGSVAIAGAYFLWLWLRRSHASDECGGRIATGPALSFAAFFLKASIVAGVDVARRVLSPTLRVSPAFISYPLRLRSLKARVFFANAVSLLPGTLSAGFADDTLEVHVLDLRQNNEEGLRALEDRIARLFPDG